MNKRQANVLQSLRGTQTFLDTNADALPSVVHRGAKTKLDTAITRLTTHAANQAGDHLVGMGLTRTKASRSRTLIADHMQPIARIARAELPDAPELAPLRMPRGELSVARLVAHAEGMAQAAEPFAATFIEWGLAPDFIAKLREAASELLATIDNRTVTRGNRRGATIGIEEQLRAARSAVSVLDAFVRSALRDNPALLQHWISASRVGRMPGRKASSDDTPSIGGVIAAQSSARIADAGRLLSAGP
jgi:hypothetical protein